LAAGQGADIVRRPSAAKDLPVRRLVLILLVVAALLGQALSAGLWTWQSVVSGPYTQDAGLAWYAQIEPPLWPLFEIASDDAAAPQGAEYALGDAQGPLGPGHALHDEIRRLGSGRYSFWNGQLLFSTREGEDPNATATRLEFTGTIRLAGPVQLALDGLGLIAAALLILELRARIGLAALALFIAGFDALTLARLPHTALYTADTDGYYLLSSPRTAGYGLLMRAIQVLSGDLYLLTLLQFALAGLAALLLAAAVRRVFQAPILAAAIGVVLTVKQGLVLAHMNLLPDSLFFSCATVALGAAVLVLERPRPAWVLTLGAALALAMALRPAAIGLLPGLGLVPLLLWARHRPAAIGLAALLAAGFFANLPAQHLAESLTGRAGAGAGKFSGFVLIGSAGFLLTPETPTDQPALRDALAAALAPIRADWLAAETLDAKRQVVIEDQDKIIYGSAQPIACHPPPKDCTRAAVDAALRGLALDAIRADPWGMATEFAAKAEEDAANTLSGDWLVRQDAALAGSRASLAGSTVAREQLADQPWDLDPRADTMAPDPLGFGRLLYRQRAVVNAVLLAAALAVSLWFLAALLRRRRDPETQALGVAALGFLGYHGFVCILEVPIFRYAEPLAAWYLLSLGGGLSLALRRFRERVT
jgi:hypothetical protein